MGRYTKKTKEQTVLTLLCTHMIRSESAQTKRTLKKAAKKLEKQEQEIEFL